jgi:hypothetical protein
LIEFKKPPPLGLFLLEIIYDGMLTIPENEPIKSNIKVNARIF